MAKNSSSLWLKTTQAGQQRWLSTSWNNVQRRLPRLAQGFERHHSVFAQRGIRRISNALNRVSPRFSRGFERYANSEIKVLSRHQHGIADRFVRGTSVPFYARGAFNPVRAWTGFTPAQRAWGAGLSVATGIESFQTTSSIVGSFK